MVGTRKPTQEELDNDPTLQYTPYKRYEILWVKPLKKICRFLSYCDDGKKIRLTERDSLRDVPEAVPALSVKRPSYEDLVL